MYMGMCMCVCVCVCVCVWALNILITENHHISNLMVFFPQNFCLLK